MEELRKSFIMDLCKSLRSQMSEEIWKDFDSAENSGKVSFLVQRTNVLEGIESQIEEELKKHQSQCQAQSSERIEEIREILDGWDFRKSRSKALLFKDAGNQAFGSGENQKALELYSYGIAFMEPSEKTDLSILYGNRSAALFHLGDFILAQSDIDSALQLTYPAELHFKLYERSGRCFAKQGKAPEASRRFQQAINSLSHPLVNLDPEKKEKVKGTLAKLLKASSGTGFAFICGGSGPSTTTAKGNSDPILPSTVGGRGNYLRNASPKLSLMRSDEEGRYVVANENILPGEIIVVEKAYASVLTQEAYNHQCFQCYSMLSARIPCSGCALVSFCSGKCRDLAWSSHHQYECAVLGILRLAGISITCLMALRALTQTPFPEIRNWESLLWKEECPTTVREGKRKKVGQVGNWRDFQFQFKDEYRADHISSVLRLVTHSDRRSSEDYFHRSIMALFLVSVLKRTGFFHNSSVGVEEKETRGHNRTGDSTNGHGLDGKIETNEPSGEFRPWPDDDGENGRGKGNAPSGETIILVGSILVRMLQTLQFNAHEIAGWDPNVSKSCFIGGGLFPTLAFFNHSCNPAIVRYFINDTVVVRTVRTIQRGEPVTENYGAVFTQSGKEERQAYLKSRYWFDCQCEACLDDWPLFINLSRDNLSFRCQNCRSYLCKTTTESFNLLLRCSRCLKPTNMLQSLKSLEKSEGKFNQATECMNQGKRETAAGILLENMSLFDSILLPPFPDYHWCQEGLRKCYLPMGNQCNSLKLSSPPAGGSTTIVG